MRRARIGAIDVGTTKICSIIAESIDGGLRILGTGITPSNGLQKGLVVNINEARQSIRQAVRMAEQTAGHRMESASIGVTGCHVSSINNRGVVAITRGDQVVRHGDLRRVLQVAQTVKVPHDAKLLHVIPRNYAIDDQGGVKDPVGMHGFRLDVETHIITAGAASIQNLTDCIESLGVKIDGLVLESLASAEATLTPEEKDSGVILADIGGGTTDVAIFKNSSICHSAVVPVAGYQITRDISIGMKIPHEIAEEIKIRYGNVIPTDQQEAEDKTFAYSGYHICYRDLCDIVRLRVEELLRLIVMELPEDIGVKLVPAGLVLTGGSANLPGIAELATQISKLPSRVGIPRRIYSVSDNLNGPAFATGIGLILWKATNQDAKGSYELTSFRNFLPRLARVFR